MYFFFLPNLDTLKYLLLWEEFTLEIFYRSQLLVGHLILKFDIKNLHTVIWFQVFLFDTNNLHTIIWFQVTIPVYL